MTNSAPRLILATCLIALAVRAADYRTAYLDGIRAYQSNRFEDAEASFRIALKERPQEAARAMAVGGHRDPYLPHFYLGAALARQGRCAAARDAFATSLTHGVLQKSPEHEAYLRLAKTCRDPGTPEGAAAPLPTSSATDTTALAVPPTTTSTGTDGVSSSAGAPPNNPSPLNGTPPTVVPSTSTTGVGKPASPPAALFDAFDLLMRGRYVAAITILNDISDSRPRIRGEVHLLRSAARFALFEIEGRIHPSLEAAARADALAARKLLPNGQITMPDAFSPKFRRFFATAK